MNNSNQIFRHISAELSAIYPLEEASEIAFSLLFHFGKLTKSDVLAEKQLLLPSSISLDEVLSRLKNHEPIQHIIKTVYFCELTLHVNHHVLIPRIETEELVGFMLKDLENRQTSTIVDFGTGSGCIAIALKKNKNESRVFAIDISENALDVAQKNAVNNQVEVEFCKADILDISTLDFLPTIDVIVSNPPYILPSEKHEMSPNVLNFEPHLALFIPENDPLKFYKAILEIAETKLISKGVIYFEINHLMGEAIKELFSQHHYQNIKIKKDMFGKERFAIAQKP